MRRPGHRAVYFALCTAPGTTHQARSTKQQAQSTMTPHLSDDALLEIIETGGSHPHIAQCDRCRRAFEDARDGLALARGEHVPEPSPLFWNHLSARVHDEVGKERAPGSHRAFAWFLAPGWRSVAAVALVVVAVAMLVWRTLPAGDRMRQSASIRTTSAPPVARPAANVQVSDDSLVPAADASWTVIAQVTAHVEIADATEAGIVLQPGASDRAISQLSPSEQEEFVRLLQMGPEGPSQ